MAHATSALTHPVSGHVQVSHNPDLRIVETPWPAGMAVSVDPIGGAWNAAEEGSYEGECHRCNGRYEVRGGRPRFCPWCSEPQPETGDGSARFVPCAVEDEADE